MNKHRRGKGEGAIYQRGDGYWVGSVDLGWHSQKRRRKYVYGKTRREVVAKMRPLVRAAEAGRIAPDRTPTLSEWMDTYMTQVAATSVRPSTLARYEQELRLHINPELGPIRLDKIQPRHLSAFYRERLQTLAPSSVRRMHAFLRRSFNVAMRWGLVTANPALLVDPPPLPHHEVRPLSLDEARRLLTAAKDTTMQVRWSLAVMLGLRQGEVLGLRWEDVDLDLGLLSVRRALQRQSGKLVLVQPKTQRSRRTVRMPASVTAGLKGHRERQERAREAAGDRWEDTGLVFTTRVGTPIHPRNDYRAFRALLKRAGLRQVRLHDLRHTAASLMLAQHVPARVVMEVLGHSQISLTMNTYTHVAPQSLTDAAEKMEDALCDEPDDPED